MTAILLIARRELGSYLRTMTGYVIGGLFLFATGLLFMARSIGGDDKLSAQVLASFFENASGVTMVASVAISMRLIAEERQIGTLVLLTSSPVRDWQIVFGKFLSALIFLALVLAVSVYIPLLVMVNGKISWGHLGAGYLGLLLLGGATLAIGTVGSALARTQVLAAIISTILVVTMLVCWFLARVTEPPFKDLFDSLALWQKHFQPFMRGAIHLRDVVYYLLVTYVGLFAANRVMEARRWR
jgi:ABC-2 type transport system permease protein